MTDCDELVRLIETQDAELADGLQTALETDPDAVRAWLRSEGFLDPVETHSEPELTDAEAALLDIIDDLGTSKSSGEIREIIEIEYPEKLEEYSSLQHRSWISDKLNSLAKKGYIGKYRDGREVKFTPEPTEAVREWARQNARFISELSRTDAEEIATDTGMNFQTVKNAIQRLKET